MIQTKELVNDIFYLKNINLIHKILKFKCINPLKKFITILSCNQVSILELAIFLMRIR
jgi:hypothetical protein